MKRVPLVVLGLLLLALSLPSLPSWNTASPTFAETATAVAVPQHLRDRIRREGRVRVIVELQLPGTVHLPEGFLSGPAAVLAQRQNIAAVHSQVLARLRATQHRVIHTYETVPLLALEVSPAALAELEASSFYVRRVMEDTLAEPMLAESGPLVEANLAWARGFDGTGTMVAILDTGVDSSHPFLAGKVVEEACFSSNMSGGTTVCPNGLTQQIGAGAGVPCLVPGCNHGTHVAGIAAGNGAGAGQSFSGIAKGAQIMAVQIFSRFDAAASCSPAAPPCVLSFSSDQIRGLERVFLLRDVRNFASANMSLGGGLFSAPCDGQPQRLIIENLRSVGIATVIASGNNGSRNQISAPACISSAVSVGSTTKTDVVSSFSNMASFMSLLAPGSSINSSVPGGGFAVFNGTSMATPHVAGAWAILKQAAPSATVSQILTALQTTGLPVTDTRSGGTVTKPRIRIDQAVATFAAGPTLTVDTTTAAPGAPVTVTLTNGRGGALDWLAIAATTDPDTSYIDYTYIGAGVTTFTWTVNMPATPGTYEFRLFLDNGFARAATSPTVTVTTGGGSPTLNVSATTVPFGTPVTVMLTNGPGGALDWLAYAAPTDPDTSYLDLIYPGAGATTFNWTVTPPAPGPYQFRLFLNNGFTRAATSPTVTVTP